jgi:hypothetical protein
MVRLAGFEPAAYRLGICRSILLSYRRIDLLFSGIPEADKRGKKKFGPSAKEIVATAYFGYT